VEEATEKGLQKGIEKGIEKGKIEVAHTLLQKGSDLAFIAEVTGLPMDNIRGLQKT
jgi:predicted transposase/invertase (TIGR01784 family)